MASRDGMLSSRAGRRRRHLLSQPPAGALAVPGPAGRSAVAVPGWAASRAAGLTAPPPAGFTPVLMTALYPPAAADHLRASGLRSSTHLPAALVQLPDLLRRLGPVDHVLLQRWPVRRLVPVAGVVRQERQDRTRQSRLAEVAAEHMRGETVEGSAGLARGDAGDVDVLRVDLRRGEEGEPLLGEGLVGRGVRDGERQVVGAYARVVSRRVAAGHREVADLDLRVSLLHRGQVPRTVEQHRRLAGREGAGHALPGLAGVPGLEVLPEGLFLAHRRGEGGIGPLGRAL